MMFCPVQDAVRVVKPFGWKLRDVSHLPLSVPSYVIPVLCSVLQLENLPTLDWHEPMLTYVPCFSAVASRQAYS